MEAAHLSVNYDLIDKRLIDFQVCGTEPTAKHGLVVSFTSFPARIAKLHYVLYSLLVQTLKPKRLILWLGQEEFPGEDGDLPPKLLSLRRNGLEIRWTKDIKQYKKLLSAWHNNFGPSILNFATSGGGILYPPGVLHQDVLDEDLAFRLAPLSDDIMYWATAVLNDSKTKNVAGNIPSPLEGEYI